MIPQKETYEGEFKNDERDGECTLENVNGVHSGGNYCVGKMIGDCKIFML